LFWKDLWRGVIEERMKVLARQLQRGFVLVGGMSLVLVGLAMVVLPGPGALVILGGLALLSTEFPWARGPLERARSWIERGAAVARSVWVRARHFCVTSVPAPALDTAPGSVRVLPPSDDSRG